jgi:GNAT superfamily N-acetyltransferase
MEVRMIRHGDTELQGPFFRFVNGVFRGSRDESWALWRDHGGWTEAYEVFAIMDGERIASTIGRSRMQWVVDGQVQTGFQLGAVATLEPYRRQTYARQLMDRVIAQSEGPLILFANRSSVAFYPKFGFTRVAQRRSTAACVVQPSRAPAVRCDLSSPAERARLAALCARARPIRGRLTARDYGWIALWNLCCGPVAAFWLPDHDAVVATTVEPGRLIVHDVIAPNPFSLRTVVPSLITQPIATVEFLFDPEDWWQGAEHADPDDTDSPLFVLGLPASFGGPVQFPDLART